VDLERDLEISQVGDVLDPASCDGAGRLGDGVLELGAGERQKCG
jgi:hypothetical protein